MFSSVIFTTLVAASSSLLALADPVPTAPGPGDTFKEGSNCTFAWDGDSASTAPLWKVMNVELMSGSNQEMNHITTVGSVDGTTTGTYSYPCPNVTPNSAIYFYQFTSPDSSDITWTTRFTIEAADGSSTPPANANQPTPATPPIPWGIGALTDPSLATPPPPIGTASASSGASSASTAAAASGGAGSPVTGAAPTSSGFVSTAVASVSASKSATPSTTPSSGASMLAGSVLGSFAALGAVVALVY